MSNTFGTLDALSRIPAPMPETMSPREKVENALYSMEDWRHASPEYLIENILTALASGSGDHAELIEDAIEALQIIDAFPSNQGEVEGRITEKGDRLLASCTRDARLALEALIAEVAALRERLETARFDRVEHNRQFEEMRTRATEAERKLAEARETLIQADLTIRSFSGADQSDVEFIRTFLSKEAERG